jgi:hypothetical protein
MSSETWTDAAGSRRNPGDSSKPTATPNPDALQPWQLFTLAGLIGATVVVFVSRGHAPAGIVLLSLTVFAAAIVGIAAWRTFGPLAAPEDVNSAQILGGRTRAALEREKSLVLRSLKELEFDRAMGKVAEKDFTEMGARLRARAARLIRQLDAGTTYRGDITKEIERRLGAADKVRPAAAMASGPAPEAPADPPSRPHPEAPPPAHAVKCAHCGTENDSDAQFCKRCGASLEASE